MFRFPNIHETFLQYLLRFRSTRRRCFAMAFLLAGNDHDEMLVLRGEVFGPLGKYSFLKWLARHGNDVGGSI